MKGLRAMRRAAGISQAELARRVGVTTAAVCKWENGQSWPSAWYIPAIAEALGCNIAQLYAEPEDTGGMEGFGPDDNDNQKTEG